MRTPNNLRKSHKNKTGQIFLSVLFFCAITKQADKNEVKIEGEPRVMGGRIDMGADEVGEKQADFTRDGRIDILDLAELSGSWETAEGEMNWYVLSDLFEDGEIDISDLAMFTSDWLWVADWVE